MAFMTPEVTQEDFLSVETTHVCGYCGEEMDEREGTFCGSCEPDED